MTFLAVSRRPSPCFRCYRRGFSLIELLVALVISVVGALAIMQIYVGSEAGKRATGSLAEAQSGGLAALFAIERDMQQAGMNFMNLAALGCNIRSNLASTFGNRPLQPVSIIPAGAAIGAANNLWGIPPGDAGSDMLIIVAGDGSALVEGATLSVAAPAGSMTFRLSNVLGIRQNDYLLMGEPGKDCTLTRVTATDASGDVTVNFGGAEDYAINSWALHLGRAPQLLVYAVRNGTLTRCDFLVNNCSDAFVLGDTTVWVPVANDVVALVAQYGVDVSVPVNQSVELYCKTRVPAGGVCPVADTGLPAPGNLSLAQNVRACDWARVPLVQLALVSRSGQFEKEMVSPATIKLWPDSAPLKIPSTTGPEWAVADRHYRYRITRSAVALRNAIWMGAQTTCL